MQVNSIFKSTLQDFEAKFLDIPRFVPNLIHFHTNANIYKGVYEEKTLLGTFVLQPYFEIEKSGVTRVLRVERPLVLNTLGGRKRSEVFEEMNSYVTKFASSHLYDCVEMELYDRIDDDIFFPSSLSTIGTFNLLKDFESLQSDAFEEVKTTLCFEFPNDIGEYKMSKGTYEPMLTSGWSFATRKPRVVCRQFSIYRSENASSGNVISINPYFISSFPLTAFNFPEYFLVKNGSKSSVIQWYPDFFQFSKNGWALLVGSLEEIRSRVMNIDKAKIYRIVGPSPSSLFNDIDNVWTRGPLSHVRRLQIFSSMHHYDDLNEAGGKLVHTLRLLRQNVSFNQRPR